MAEVRLENVSKLFGRKRVISDVSFTCREGEFLTIFGPTGAGKSTILKMIAGIETVSEGKIYFNEKVVNDLPPQERNVSMAFESYNLYPHMSVYENIAFPLRAPRWGLKLSKEEERKKVCEIAEFLGIDQLLERLPQHLSGGQKQRVSLGRALVRQPEVFLLDEPIAHLDARLKFSTQTLLKEFAKNYRSTIIYVTHDYREALALSDRVILLRRGRVEQEGTPKEVYYTPVSDFAGRMVGDPPMNLLDGEVQERDGEVFFKIGDSLSIKVRNELIPSLKAAMRDEDGKKIVRMGIRCEHIKMSREKMSKDSFQLPVYAVVSEAQSILVSFHLDNDVIFHARSMQQAVYDYNVHDKIWLEFDQNHMFFFPKTIELT